MSLGENFNAEGIDEQYEAFMADDPESYVVKEYETSTKAEPCRFCDDNAYLTRQEVADITRATIQTVDNWISSRKLGSSRFSGRTLVKVSDLKAFEYRVEAEHYHGGK